jgi:hypothetical protein
MVKDILKLIPVIQSASVLKDNIEFTEKKRASKTSDFVKQGVKNLVGISLIKSTADSIEFFED